MSTTNQQLRPLILDFGSNTFRMGWAMDDSPVIIAPAVYADIKDYLFESDVIDGLEDLFIEDESEEYLFGYEALKYQNILKIHEFKKENNYSVLLKYFHYYYQQLKIEPEFQYKQPLILLAPFFSSELEKNKLRQIFFGTFNFPAILFLPESQAILSTLQKTSGVIVNLGESHTYISSVFRGFTNIMARDSFPVAGNELTNYFLTLIMTKKGTGKKVFLEKWLAKEIKEKSSLCVLNPKEEIAQIRKGFTNYDQVINFPDGASIEINYERFMLSEPIFDPRIIHIDYIGLAEAIVNVIKSWDRENWEDLVQTIVLSGGGSLIPGLKERLSIELIKYFSDKIKPKINVIAVTGRDNMAWLGGSVLFSKDQLKGWIQNPIWVEQSTQNEEINPE